MQVTGAEQIVDASDGSRAGSLGGWLVGWLAGVRIRNVIGRADMLKPIGVSKKDSLEA
jgi:hypothetical protein